MMQKTESSELKNRKAMVLTVPFPPSANRYWGHARGRTFLNHAARKYRQDVMDAVVLLRFDQMRERTPLVSIKAQRIFADRLDDWALRGPLEVTIELSSPRKGKWDLDNRIKQLLDALQNAGVFEDDEQIVRLTAVKAEQVPGGKCTVIIQEVESGQ